VNAKKNDGWTPLHHAIQFERENIVSILLENGADPTITNKDGKTPLQIAQDHNNQNCVAAILRNQIAKLEEQEQAINVVEERLAFLQQRN
jgi:ankyrin repeat protein